MLLFESYMKDGMCIRGEDWGQVDPEGVKALVVYSPFTSGLSVVLEAITDSAEYFLWKEGLAALGGDSSLVRVVFGKREAGREIKILYIIGGGIEVVYREL